MKSVILLLLFAASLHAAESAEHSRWAAPSGAHYSGDYHELEDDEGQGYVTIHIRPYSDSHGTLQLWVCIIEVPGMVVQPVTKIMAEVSVDSSKGAAILPDGSKITFIKYSEKSYGLVYKDRTYKR